MLCAARCQGKTTGQTGGHAAPGVHTRTLAQGGRTRRSAPEQGEGGAAPLLLGLDTRRRTEYARAARGDAGGAARGKLLRGRDCKVARSLPASGTAASNARLCCASER
jgi:hypothetical protein